MERQAVEGRGEAWPVGCEGRSGVQRWGRVAWWVMVGGVYCVVEWKDFVCLKEVVGSRLEEQLNTLIDDVFSYNFKFHVVRCILGQ